VIDGSEVGDIEAEAGRGAFVGATGCHAEGCQVWSNVSTEGTMVTSRTGDGADDGPAVTISEGSSEGTCVGEEEGCCVWESLGRVDGPNVGA
jgi:hypothetical protein